MFLLVSKNCLWRHPDCHFKRLTQQRNTVWVQAVEGLNSTKGVNQNAFDDQ